LELTRRARVCVWDDLVDIPVATPMRVPSAEMRRRNDIGLHKDIDEEMDISTANDSTPQPDLLGLSTPPANLPNPNRFELGTPRASEDVPPPISPTASIGAGPQYDGTSKNGQVKFVERPPTQHARNRMSYDEPSRSQASGQPQARRFSFSTRGRGSMFYDGDDLEGDLGYAAAEGMEGNRRKVIVERLETVKSKNPVFTWC